MKYLELGSGCGAPVSFGELPGCDRHSSRRFSTRLFRGVASASSLEIRKFAIQKTETRAAAEGS
jgi:hypothetical protein